VNISFTPLLGNRHATILQEAIANTVTKRDGIRHELCAFPHIAPQFLIWYNLRKQCNPVQDCSKTRNSARRRNFPFCLLGRFPQPPLIEDFIFGGAPAGTFFEILNAARSSNIMSIAH
jgi:hypothetical protein